jgi:WD40 repeat protein
MDEIRHSRSDAHTVSADSRKNRALFIDSAWQTFGQAHFVDEKARIVMNRRTVSVRFSPLQPHLLVTAHPFPDNPDNGDDGHPLKVREIPPQCLAVAYYTITYYYNGNTRTVLVATCMGHSKQHPLTNRQRHTLAQLHTKKNRACVLVLVLIVALPCQSFTMQGLYSIWDVFTPGAPVHVLAASGQPTCCCFSSAQTFLLLAGTAEGSLHLWDLRENTLIHKER